MKHSVSGWRPGRYWNRSSVVYVTIREVDSESMVATAELIEPVLSCALGASCSLRSILRTGVHIDLSGSHLDSLRAGYS